MAELPEVEPLPHEHFRFHVISRTDPAQRYLVDLEGYRFNGWCGCDRFKFACEPKLSRGAKPNDVFRCWHIRRARSYFTDAVLPKLAAALSGKKPEPDDVPPLEIAAKIIAGLDLGGAMAARTLVENRIDELT